LIREAAAQASPSEAAQFFTAQNKGAQKMSELEQVSQRTKILLVIAVLWEIVAEFKSTGELFQWLRSMQNKGQYLIAPSTDSREIRTICKAIGLRYDNRGGRPPNENQDLT
jgi:hypothetical protein